MTYGNPRLTIALVIILAIAALVMFAQDAPAQHSERPFTQYCHSDGRCTSAVGAFWAEVDSLDTARFWDESLPADEAA